MPKSICVEVAMFLAELDDHIDEVAFDCCENLKAAHDAGDALDVNCLINLEADDPKDPLPRPAKKAAGARALAMFLAELTEADLAAVIGK